MILLTNTVYNTTDIILLWRVFMFLRKSCSHGKVYLSFVQSCRDETGKVKQKTIKKLGFLDGLEKISNVNLSKKYLTLSEIKKILNF